MSLSILVIYLPVMLYYLVYNIKDTLFSYKNYDYGRIHWSASPYPWNTVLFIPSWVIPPAVMNQPWIPIATTVAIVVFFGTTAEAKETYRGYSSFIGLETCVRRFKRGNGGNITRTIDTSEGTQNSGNDLLKHPTIMK